MIIYYTHRGLYSNLFTIIISSLVNSLSGRSLENTVCIHSNQKTIIYYCTQCRVVCCTKTNSVLIKTIRYNISHIYTYTRASSISNSYNGTLRYITIPFFFIPRYDVLFIYIVSHSRVHRKLIFNYISPRVHTLVADRVTRKFRV